MKHPSHLVAKICIVGVIGVSIIAFVSLGRVTQLFNQGKSINVLVWGQVLDKEFLSDFEQETGIHVNMSYFENNQELFVKLQSTDIHDYDLIMPSDWAVELLIQHNLIKKIDHSKVDVWNNLYPTLCNLYYDPANEYSIPYFWSVVGLGVDTAYWQGQMPPATWGLIFDQQIMPQRVGSAEDPRVIILTAAVYLFGHIQKQLTSDQMSKIKQLLIQQKRSVEIYTDSRSEYVLASGVVPVIIALSGDLLKIMKRFNNINFIIPKEGAFALIDSFAITAATKKDDLIYSFLNYIFRPDVVKKYVDKFDFFPAVQIDVEYDDRFEQITKPTETLFKNINFFKNVVSYQDLNDLLIALKS
ncbi:MAG TPA: spermidine/putrescine ABC transporter substrate-binding protein [Candidatus Babeliales bacterium]|nr:spermidine/putrescine ABC transporter substrate-binding protein [Candidatus Babeliales bacterium]